MTVALTNPGTKRTLALPARPEALEMDLAETALIVIDMQHAYLSTGGYLDLVGFDISGAPKVIEAVRGMVDAARAAGLTIIFVRNGFDPEQHEAGPASAPVYHKSNPLKFMRANPDHRGKLITKGAWDYGFVDALTPGQDDIVIHKSRYSAFAGTNLEPLLRGRRISNLLICGVNTNVCVESTIRDGFHREFFCVMIEDATLQAGERYIFDATVFNIERFLGWVTTTADAEIALKASA